MNSQCSNKESLCVLRDVSKEFTNKIILRQLNFSFLRGKNYLIKGESGVGKTTLLNILAGLEKVDHGLITYSDGIKIEYMFQDILLFPTLTVYDNLFLKVIGCVDVNSVQAENDFPVILEKVGLDPNILRQKVSVLSGGEKRRLQLAQIILTNPQLILFDEPTANLDHGRKQTILNLLATTFTQATKIIVSHDVEHYRDWNYALLELHNGRLNYV